jgi:hypothetical protein
VGVPGLQGIYSCAPNQRYDEDGTGHTSRSSGLLRVKESQARVSQSDIKTCRGAMVGGARGTVTKVT